MEQPIEDAREPGNPERLVLAYCVLLILMFAGIAYLAFSVGSRKEDWLAIIEAMRAWGDRPWSPLLILGAYYVGSLLAMPGLLMLGVLVTCLGDWMAPVISVVGTALSASTVHLIARRTGRSAFNSLYPGHLERLEHLLAGRSFLRVVQMRLLPVLPFHLVNAACGLVGIPLRPFVLGTALGLLPKMLVQLFFVRSLLAGLTAARTVVIANLVVSLTLFVIVTAAGLWMDRYIRKVEATDRLAGP